MIARMLSAEAFRIATRGAHETRWLSHLQACIVDAELDRAIG